MRQLALLLVLMAPAAMALDTVTVSALVNEIREPDNGTVGTPTQAFRLSRDTTVGALVVNISVSGVASSADYTLSTSSTGAPTLAVPGTTTVTIPAGSSQVTLWLTPTDDALIEGGESVDLEVLPGDYLRDPQFSASLVIADNDLVLGWTAVSDTAEEDLNGASPKEARARLAFFDTAGTQIAPPGTIRATFKLLDEDGHATLGTDYLMTMMFRHAGQPGASILEDRSVTLAPFDETWTVGTRVSAAAIIGATTLTMSSTTNLRVNDLIKVGANTTIYQITAVGGGSINITPGLAAAAAINDPVRNNMDPIITANGGIQGVNLNATYSALDVAITPKYDSDVEGAEPVVMRLLSSPDYVIRSPNDLRLTISDDDLLAQVTAISNAVRPSTNGIVRITFASPTPKAVQVPFTVTGTAGYSALSSPVTVPAGTTTYDLVVQPGLVAINGTVVITMLTSRDYAIAGTGPSQGQIATINVLGVGGVATISGGGGGGSDKPAPGSGGSSGCGVGGGGGLTALLIAVGLAAGLRRIRAR